MFARSPIRRGLSLAEAVVSILIVGIMLPAVLNTVGASKTTQFAIANEGRGRLLAMSLMGEILNTKYEEPEDTPLFGTEGSEAATGRSAFDDVDDFHLWNASPPQNEDGTVIPGLNGWRRTAVVEWVNAADPTTTSAGETGVKRIIVTVLVKNTRVARLTAVRTRH